MNWTRTKSSSPLGFDPSHSSHRFSAPQPRPRTISTAGDLIPTTVATTTTKMALSCKVCEKGDTESAPLKKCGKCTEIYYCSAECQKQDWPAHRRYCGKAWWDNDKMRRCEDNSLHEGYLPLSFSDPSFPRIKLTIEQQTRACDLVYARKPFG